MDKLTELADLYGTDKGNVFHKFTEFYDNTFNQYRDSFKKIVEIGIWKGESLKMWKDYFRSCKIVGADIEDKNMYASERIEIRRLDQSSREQLSKFDDCIDADLIIDDGSHIMGHQQITIGTLFPKLKPGGFYILEDLHTSFYPHGYDANPNNNTYAYIEKLKNDTQTAESLFLTKEENDYIKLNVESVEIFNRDNLNASITCIIKKRGA